MKKSNKKFYIITISTILLVLLGGFLVYYFYQPANNVIDNAIKISTDTTTGIGGVLSTVGKEVDGWWDVASQQCWISKDYPSGEQYKIVSGIPAMASCCFNIEGIQVSCSDSTKIIGNKLTQQVVYTGGVGGTPSPGKFTLAHVFTVSNPTVTGAVAFDKVWIPNAVWTPVHATLTTAYAPIVGFASAQAGPISVGNFRPFSTSSINLDSIAGPVGSPTTYNLNMIVNGTAYGGLMSYSQPVTGQIKAEKEAIGFSVSIDWGA